MNAKENTGARRRLKRGLFEIYTGDGKGKSTASLGLALRALGSGLRVYYLALLKGRWRTGEHALLAAGLHPALTYRAAGGLGPGAWVEGADTTEIERVRAALEREMARLETVIREGSHDLVICDEMNVCIRHGLIPLERAIGLVHARAPWVELVYTGRDAPPELVTLADLVTEMRKVRHPYDQGIDARRGIEF